MIIFDIKPRDRNPYGPRVAALLHQVTGELSRDRTRSVLVAFQYSGHKGGSRSVFKFRMSLLGHYTERPSTGASRPKRRQR